MSLSNSVKKQPGELINLAIDFSNLLSSGDTLTGTPTVSSAIFGSSSSSDLTITNVALSSDSTQITMKVSGGTDGAGYIITAECETVNGETLEADGLLMVRELLWQSSAILILRGLINDFSTTPTYTDNRLLDILLIAALQVKKEYIFDTSYTINITKGTISPDPSSDETFLYLVPLKAACIIDRGNLRIAAMTAGLEAKCGPAVMKTMNRMDGFKTLMEVGYCKAYEEAKFQLQLGNTRHLKGILSPFINDVFDPSETGNVYNGFDNNIFRVDR